MIVGMLWAEPVCGQHLSAQHFSLPERYVSVHSFSMFWGFFSFFLILKNMRKQKVLNDEDIFQILLNFLLQSV